MIRLRHVDFQYLYSLGFIPLNRPELDGRHLHSYALLIDSVAVIFDQLDHFILMNNNCIGY